MKYRYKLLGTFFGIASLLAGLAVVAPAHTSAASIGYDPAMLISDSIFTNKSSMSTSSIQSFLKAKSSGLASYSDTVNCSSNPSYMAKYYRCSKKVSAAEIIHSAAQAYGISPKAILATLQKEQSLVTTPNPVSGQLKHAMGYGCPDGGGCDSTYYGFFNQVDWGTWQLRANIELMSGRTYMGIPPSSYPCKSASAYRSTGFFPGRQVTFIDDNNVGYRTLTLANASTASLYCYTPHTYNNPKGLYNNPAYGSKGLYYSGSYNFVTSFKKWFGSTVYKYAADVTVSTFSDEARTQELSLSGSFASGKKIYVTVSALNTGSSSWSRSFTRVGTVDPRNRQSAFRDSSWFQTNRPAQLVEASVAPGQTGTFNFSLTTPGADGSYSEGFSLVADGKSWMADNATFGFDIKVSNPYNGAVTQLKTYQDSAHTKALDDKILAYGQKAYYTLKVKNTGSQTWQKAITKLATIDPRNRSSAFYDDSSWLSTNRPAQLVEASVAPGQTGTFNFSLKAPSTTDANVESFGLVEEGMSWMPGATFSKTIKVVKQLPPKILDVLQAGQSLSFGKSITSKKGGYRLVMQGDGNLVLYNRSNRPLWHTHTNGKGGYRLVMQGDGNLVLYNRSNRPLWHTHTNGKGGYRLVMQGDGNLVLYDRHSRALWASRTVQR